LEPRGDFGGEGDFGWREEGEMDSIAPLEFEERGVGGGVEWGGVRLGGGYT